MFEKFGMRLSHIIREENFLSLAGNVIIALVGVATFSMLARTLPVEQFGQWVLFLSAGSLIEMLRFGITSTGLIRFLSGAREEERCGLLGANAVIGLTITIAVAAMLVCLHLIFPKEVQQSGYNLFFTWYPFLAFLNFPWNNALIILQADRRYGPMLFVKAFNSIPFLLLVAFTFFNEEMKLTYLVAGLLSINAATSLLCIAMKWDGLVHIRRANRPASSILLNFGRYTTFTLIGTNLLRSADTFIISISSMGSAGVALYSIPLKLTELQQIPLRSFAATAFPKMSKASLQGEVVAVKNYFYTYAGAITYLFVLISLITFVFAEYFVLVIGGEKYLGIDAVTGCNATQIVRIFSLYGLLLPIDRLTGIGLDSINKPNVNAVKVFYMLLSNIIGDLIAIFVFNSLLLVAVSSILFTVVGIYVGMQMLDKALSLEFRKVFFYGRDFYRVQFNKLFHNSLDVKSSN